MAVFGLIIGVIVVINAITVFACVRINHGNESPDTM